MPGEEAAEPPDGIFGYEPGRPLIGLGALVEISRRRRAAETARQAAAAAGA